jgi:formylglycine-generating enzyme required for sulfatase activity
VGNLRKKKISGFRIDAIAVTIDRFPASVGETSYVADAERLGDVPFPWGQQTPDDTDFLPYNIWQGCHPHQNLSLNGYVGTAPTQSFTPKGYGHYSMFGNVRGMSPEAFKVRSHKSTSADTAISQTGFWLVYDAAEG